MSMYVVKRNNKKESVHFDKITSRIQKLCGGLDQKVRKGIDSFRGWRTNALGSPSTLYRNNFLFQLCSMSIL